MTLRCCRLPVEQTGQHSLTIAASAAMVQNNSPEFPPNTVNLLDPEATSEHSDSSAADHGDSSAAESYDGSGDVGSDNFFTWMPAAFLLILGGISRRSAAA